MKIFIVKTTGASKILSFLKENLNKSEFETIELIDSNENETLASGHHIIIVPSAIELKEVFYSLTIDYPNEYRSPTHGKVPVILMEPSPLRHVIEEFLGKHYRKDRPDVPTEEAALHFVVYNKKMQDFFRFVSQVDLLKSIYQLKDDYTNLLVNLNNKETKLFVINSDYPKLKKLFEAFPTLNNVDSPEKFKAAIYAKGKAATIIGAGNGKDWDINGRSSLYNVIGKSIAKLGYSIISGGPDGCAERSGPMYHSAQGAAEAGGVLSVCYTNWIFDKLCDVEELIKMGLPLENISFVPNEAVRKKYLIDAADIVIALPGASGTLSEILAAIYLKKPVVLCNILIKERKCNFYDNFYKLLKEFGLADNVYLLTLSPHMRDQEVFDAICKSIDNSNLNLSLESNKQNNEQQNKKARFLENQTGYHMQQAAKALAQFPESSPEDVVKNTVDKSENNAVQNNHPEVTEEAIVNKKISPA